MQQELIKRRKMQKAVLVFLPTPMAGHLTSTIEVSKLLTSRHEHLSITVLFMKLPSDKKSTAESSDSRIKFVELRKEESSSEGDPSSRLALYEFIDSHKPHVREILSEIKDSESSDLAGIVVDMFCTSMMDLAFEFGIASYLCYTSGAASLGLMFHLQSLRDDFNVDVSEYENSDEELAGSTYINPVPVKCLPTGLFIKETGDRFLNQVKLYRETKGIIINTFLELESHAIQALSADNTIPPVFPIGPVLKLAGKDDQNQESEVITKWLDLQPDSSVVFLCFGSMGAFNVAQVKEIAVALEHSGYGFLWSLRRPPPKGRLESLGDYENLEEVLPEGFLQRTAEVGKIIGWAPQVTILSHPAVGVFITHCGWNSILESIWCGVPMATWPLYAEQQANACQLIKDLGLAVEIKMDYRKDFDTDSEDIVSADVIENGIKQLMDPENEIRNKMKEMKEQSRLALTEGGSSSTSIAHFIKNVIDNIPQ